MPITDDQVAALRAHLAGEFDEYQRLWASLDKEQARKGYAALVASACFEAADRKFSGPRTAGDVTEYVSDVRARFDRSGEDIDPIAAERILKFMLGSGTIDDLSDSTRFTTEIALLTALVVDLQLEGQELDALMSDARRLADEWTA